MPGENGDSEDGPVRREILKARRGLQQIANDIEMASEVGSVATENLSSSQQAELTGLMEAIDQNYAKYMELFDNTIEQADTLKVEFPQQEDNDRLQEVKSLYFQAKGYKVRLSRTSLPSLNVSNVSTSGHQSNKRALLPQIQIKRFSGDFSEWPTFHQLFTALVIDDRTLSDAERFHYLLSYLDGIALDAIRHIQVVDSNFNQAFEALVRVFDDKRRLANSYLHNLLDYKSPPGRPTVETLQSFLSKVSESITSLKNLNIPDLAEYLLCEVSLRALDPLTRESFELQWVQVGETYPNFESLKQFVENRVQVAHLTTSSHKQDSKPPQKPFKPPNKFGKGSAQALLAHTQLKNVSSKDSPTKTHSSTKFECFLCKDSHKLSACERLLKMDPAGRVGVLKTYGGCKNCLHPSHQWKFCPSQNSCRSCGKKHHTLLHLPLSSDSPSQNTSSFSSSSNVQSSSDTPKNFCGYSTADNSSGVLLGTVMCRVKDSKGKYHTVRAVLDPGSQLSFVKYQTCNELKLSSKPYDGSISGVNQANLQNIKGKVTLSIQTPVGYNSLITEAVVVPSITPPLPQSRLRADMWECYKTYQLSDPNFTEPGPIQVLLGADVYPEVVNGIPIEVCANGPRIMETIFGFTVIGKYSAESFTNNNHIALLTHADPTFHLEKFWETEEPNFKPVISSPDDVKCEKHFQETHYRSSTGRYVVALPFISPEPHVEPNINGALNRLYSLESKLSKNPDLRSEYIKFMRQYEELGHMQVATCAPKFVIPHHPVFKVDGEAKKLRVVFDASFRSKTGSLNEHLHVGPKLQADVSNILLNMRRYRFVLTCDIVKCFRQVQIRPQDRCFQQVAWRYHPKDPVTFYELNTVTYGTRPAPWLSMRAIQALVADEGNDFPNASNSLINCIYVDDVIDGRQSIEELVQLKNELIDLLARGGFSLSKWSSNYQPLLHEGESDQSVSLCKDENLTTKILGMHWNPQKDVFSYVTTPVTEGNSKRIILSTIARLFDPLGFLTPIIFHAKCIMQETWKHDLHWDQEVPIYIKNKWKIFTDQLPSLSNIAINRALPNTDTKYQLLCFCDASQHGFCSAIYLRATQGSNVTLSLLKAKSRLASMKTQTIPRLELCAAVIQAELLDSLQPFRENLNITDIYCFTDSQVVLAWLKTPLHKLQPYVSRRVQKVLESTEVRFWYHVKGAENPADVGSRGATPASLENHHLWWTGPRWCYEPIQNWNLSGDIDPFEIPELRSTKLALITVDQTSQFLEYVEKHSSWLRLVRTTAWIKRFTVNSKIPRAQHSNRSQGPLSPSEINNANCHIIRILQHAHFPEVFTSSSFNDLPLELRRLNVFIDNHGVIRVGGRLSNAPIPEEHKTPILLPARCHFTNILIRHFHKENNHVGPSTLLAILRQQYWVPHARNLVKRLIHGCIMCIRYSNKRVIPFMGNLPSSRFASVRPFSICGVDFAGHFIAKESTRRNARTFKCYLSIFVCMSTRAYHLEFVHSLSVEAFLDAFARFTARRGLPSQMMSDMGTNFVGTVNYLKDVAEWLSKEETQSGIVNRTSHLGVNWKFNPPASPHMGGSWEIAVKSVKNLLRKTFNNMSYTQEELTTVFVKIEGILNSRPLQPLPTSTDDPDALTPAHFLIGQPLTALPEIDFTNVPTSRLSRWQLIQERIQHFWRRWRLEYVSSLQRREKWTKRSANVKVGDVVLLTEPNTPPMRWPLAKILETHPGSDRTVRVVTLKTQKGVYKRPCVKLIPLLIE